MQEGWWEGGKREEPFFVLLNTCPSLFLTLVLPAHSNNSFFFTPTHPTISETSGHLSWTSRVSDARGRRASHHLLPPCASLGRLPFTSLPFYAKGFLQRLASLNNNTQATQERHSSRSTFSLVDLVVFVWLCVYVRIVLIWVISEGLLCLRAAGCVSCSFSKCCEIDEFMLKNVLEIVSKINPTLILQRCH